MTNCSSNLQYQADDEEASHLAVDNAQVHVEAEESIFSSSCESDWKFLTSYQAKILETIGFHEKIEGS